MCPSDDCLFVLFSVKTERSREIVARGFACARIFTWKRVLYVVCVLLFVYLTCVFCSLFCFRVRVYLTKTSELNENSGVLHYDS